MHCKDTTIFRICKIFRQKITLFLAFFSKITAFSYFFTQIVIYTLQNDRLNRGYCLLLSVFAIFAPLQPGKTTFAAVFYNVVCARTLYIGKTSKTAFIWCLWAFSLLILHVSTIFRFWYVCSRLCDTFKLSRLFLNKAWCLVVLLFVLAFLLSFLI